MVVKRRRKPMTEEQKKAAAERLAKARLAKGHDGSKSVHPDLLDYDDDHPLHWRKVRGWVKELNEEIKGKKNLRDSKDSKERGEYNILVNYVANLKRYLDTGVYMDHRYGRHREGKMNVIVYTMAYWPDGSPKRTIGHIYPDCGEYTKEMQEYDDRIYGTERKRPTRNSVHVEEEVLEDGGDSSTDV